MALTTPEGEGFHGYSPLKAREAAAQRPADAVRLVDGKPNGRVVAETAVEGKEQDELRLRTMQREVSPDNWPELKAGGFLPLYTFDRGESVAEVVAHGVTIRRLERQLGADNVRVGDPFSDELNAPERAPSDGRVRSVYVRAE